ncbi:MAG: hypothetical protein ABH834_03015 [Candidatus Altiarchaeota archaeon]
MMTTLKKASKGIPIALLIFLLSTTVNAQANQTKTDTVSISVTVAQKTLIDVSPTTLSWTNVDPGSFGDENGFVIENVGSTNISYLWFNSTYPSSMPFGSGDNASYNAGNYVQIRQNSSGEMYYPVDRWEYNETPLIYLTTPSSYAAQGRIRLGNVEYFWFTELNGADGCNDTAARFYIGESAHNQSQDGTIDFDEASYDTLTTGDSFDVRRGVFEGVSGEWGWADVVIGTTAAGTNVTVAVNGTCDIVRFYHWNKDAPGGTAAGNTFTEYFSDTSNRLSPGETRIANVRVAVPFGVHAGAQTPGTLTVIALAVDVTG